MKTVLVTGATGKFGKILVPAFVKNNWRVIITGRSKTKLADFISDYSLPTDLVFPLELDLTNSAAISKIPLSLNAANLSVSHLVNNARSLESLSTTELGLTETDMFLKEFRLNVVSAYELSTQLAFSNHPLESIVNISSMYGLVASNPFLYQGNMNQSPIQYGASKSALNHLTKELAVRFASRNIRVNCVAFGGVIGRVDDAFISRYAQLVPSARMLNEHEIIGPVEFLLGSNSSAINGHVLSADGGWTIW